MRANDTAGASTREIVLRLARRHGIIYSEVPEDRIANMITRLSDDEVATDETEDLIVALRRAGVIDGPTMVTLLGEYIDEQCLKG